VVKVIATSESLENFVLAKGAMADAAKKESSATRVFARIRQIMPWEDKFLGVGWTDNAITVNREGKDPLGYNFGKVFSPSHTNEDAFEIVCMPLLERVLNGFNAIMIAYGQTGSGKTYTMLGKQKLEVEGLIPKCLQFFADDPNVDVSLSCIEAFGHHPSKIALYDLFDQKGTEWKDKIGASMMDPKKITRRKVESGKCLELVEEAHSFSHFAPTGKNPESSRGHVAFIITVKREVDYSTQSTYFICVDLAGSEGETSLTGDFAKKATSATITARRLEAGCINTGLSQLQVIFGELASKGKLGNSQGNGLRRILHPFINNQTFLSVIFCLSPSRVNNSSTIATLKFASRACKIKTKPVKAAKKTSLKQLKHILMEREEQIEDLHGDLQDLERDLDISSENFHNVKDQLNVLFATVRQSKKPQFKKDSLISMFEKVASEFLDSDFQIENAEEIGVSDNSVDMGGAAGMHHIRPSSIFFEQEKKRASVALELVQKMEKSENEAQAPDSMVVHDDKVILEAEEVNAALEDGSMRNRDVAVVEQVVDEEMKHQIKASEKYTLIRSNTADQDDMFEGLENEELTKEQLMQKVIDLELKLSFQLELNKNLEETHSTQLTYVTKKKPTRTQYTFFPT